ncbi:hypothetical protein GL305_22965 [Nocardia seriolae]|uniref:hypothetical protein n=1 Tax=Nocardia seriolae TaxID=37332 RepID=UPI0012BCA3C2|nr:hypothetical protein [Nocardia seriolae]MTJ63452.1 hypothetical protein [Nocardia seriolae]MTJ73772.1 hypothetical protein [Nocardia seriolae]MTJ88747.1 hypothetical protein [Nocardia seriolae]MTK32727.1 hypothetical protein [Nocardia seriolae]MTK41352.1 hypothetical protein [Nocardia seriolae]
MDRNAFVEVMNEASGMLEAGRAEEALARLTVFDDGLAVAPEPKDYGWIVSYRFRSAFAAGDYAQALHLAEHGPARFPADIPPATLATMYSMAVEAATQQGLPDSAVLMADRCIDLRRGHGEHAEVLMAAMTACTLLGDLERHDLASRYAQLLITEGVGHDDYRGYGYDALCAAIEEGVGGHLIDTLRAGREWLESQDNEFARVALEYLQSAPALREPLAVNLDLADPLGNGVPLSDPLGAPQPLDNSVPPGPLEGAVPPGPRNGVPFPDPAAAPYAMPTPDVMPAPDAMQTQYLHIGDGVPHTVAGPPQPPAEMLAGGETADALMDANRPGIAAAAYRALIDDAVNTGRPDPLIMGKATLGLLTALIFDNRVGEAHSVWVDEHGPTYLGVWSLENGQTSVHDAIAYNLVAAFLHSLSTGDPNAANHAVDALMSRNVEWAYENDPQAVPAMINTWRRHLLEIHSGEPAPEYRWQLTQAEQRWGHPIPEGGLYWMRPYRWVDWV